ncbi:CRISPR-associated endonuclease Cas2 [Thermosipho ferrireducens]|uniref:CRISPR-associated endoribonuclease Cas2 n=1 Tax=Thermosipho ferrireducens TaxID=2571116 RepID=A0ABX7S5T8_9BACT|nr:CRISPR-associated endonuclease Cas2 [Thermosipho ferrireducens]QTA37929.1 CRISPR-associated endonuclease Cas2 [Thermosipho ferrireducens]
MYIIMVYDIKEKRVAKILKIARKYLNWVQNSVLEGELTNSQFRRLKFEIKEKLNVEEDFVIYFILKNSSLLKKEIEGTPKVENTNFL